MVLQACMHGLVWGGVSCKGCALAPLGLELRGHHGIIESLGVFALRQAVQRLGIVSFRRAICRSAVRCGLPTRRSLTSGRNI